MPCPWCRPGDFAAKKTADAQRKIDDLFGKSGISTKWRTAALSDFNPRLVDSVNRRISQRLGFFVWGPVGTGKTHLMAAALNQMMSRGQSALYITVPDLLLRIRSTFDRNDPQGEATEAALIAAASSVDWLGLDDIGIGPMSDWARVELFQVINRRYDSDKPIIATSNLAISDLEAERFLGAPIASRLHALCGKPLALGGQDRRR